MDLLAQKPCQPEGTLVGYDPLLSALRLKITVSFVISIVMIVHSTYIQLLSA